MSDDTRLCSIEECSNQVKSRGWCMKHYARWQRHGDPLGKAEEKPFEHGTRQGYERGKCRCDKCRSEMARLAREYNRKTKERDGVSANTAYRYKRYGPPADCVFCGEQVTRSWSDSPMHRECWDKVPRWKREGRPGPAQRRALGVLERAARGASGGKRVWTSGNCPWCGEFFTSPNAKFCSVDCRKSERRFRQGDFVISPLVRNQIHERDGWTCQICFLPTTQEYLHNNSLSPTLDHIEPQSAALIPDHSPENLRTCHLWCNSYRGDGTRFSDYEVAMAARKLLGGDALAS